MYIPADIRQTPLKYALGEYIIHPSHSNNYALEQWIKELQFESCEAPDQRMQLHSRKRNQLYAFNLPAVENNVVLKVSQISKHYKWYRKLNLILLALIKNYSLNAYYGGVALEKINVDSIKVIAHWTCKRQAQNEKSYLLYEQVDAHMSVQELCKQLNAHNPDAPAIVERIAQSLAAVIRHLHQNNIRHGDPHAGNFLLSSPIKEISQLSPEDVNDMKFTLIDLDKTEFVKDESRWKKKCLDIRCIRRFRVASVSGSESLKFYLARPASLIEKGILKFWMKGGWNIYKWFKRSKKRH